MERVVRPLADRLHPGDRVVDPDDLSELEAERKAGGLVADAPRRAVAHVQLGSRVPAGLDRIEDRAHTGAMSFLERQERREVREARPHLRRQTRDRKREQALGVGHLAGTVGQVGGGQTHLGAPREERAGACGDRARAGRLVVLVEQRRQQDPGVAQPRVQVHRGRQVLDRPHERGRIQELEPVTLAHPPEAQARRATARIERRGAFETAARLLVEAGLEAQPAVG